MTEKTMTSASMQEGLDRAEKGGPSYGSISINENSKLAAHNVSSIQEDQRPLVRRILSRSNTQDGARPTRKVNHLGSHRQYWRDIILGVNDGLISTFLLVVGVVGSGLSSTDVLLTAMSGALAGAISMSAGEFVATKSQNEVLDGEKELEKRHIKDFPQEELSEVTELLELIGIPQENASLHRQLLEHYGKDPEALLKIMIALEFGMIKEEERSPCAAALMSGALFFCGSLPSLIPFLNCDSTQRGLLGATIGTGICLLLVGGIKTWATRGSCVSSAIENLAVAGLGGILAYWVGKMFDGIVHG